MESLDKQVEETVALLRQRGYRLTPQRLAIVRAALSGGGHPTAEEIHKRVSGDFPMLSLATVYKTLSVLEDLGVLMKIEVDGVGHYDSRRSPHPHLICVKCHRVEDLPPETMCSLPEEAMEQRSFKPLWAQLEIYGVCSRCRNLEDQRRKPQGTVSRTGP